MKQILLSLVIIVLLCAPSSLSIKTKLTKKLTNYCTTLADEFPQIPEARQADLRALGQYLFEKVKAEEEIKLTVICTHNSRRSHIGQLWLLVAADWYGIDNLHAFSGGTEATAFNVRAVDALNRAGFKIGGTNSIDNATYGASWHRGSRPNAKTLMFSKKYDHSINPKENFAAIMVCSEADESCPIVPGAEARFSLPFDDPRYFDGTASEALEYDKTCRLIARDIFYAVNHAKELMVIDAEGSK
ncbi:hypothetical protein [Lewinella cohaerens]|uniref:hypothetical protein n=1 Tax=Lewinella cohaerens TaxID=70995 RepID=UPI0003788CC4|nr:hypothetical protein [Lewinella cohaerens]